MSSIVLPVSLGEAIDKLTILDIKVEKISDARKEDCLKEYNLLYESLKSYVIQYPYHYKVLKEVNYSIWNLQEHIHKDKKLAHTYGEILKENDRRFRVKAKLNHIASSSLKEQKGYAKKRAFIYTHLGLGDHFWMNGAVRYLSTCYDTLYVVCKEVNVGVVKEMYADDPSIMLYIIRDDSALYPFASKKHFIEDEGVDVYSCGYHTDNPSIYDFPHSFYDDMSLKRSLRTNYFYVEPRKTAIDLYNLVKDISTSYVLLHQQSSQKTVDIFSKLSSELSIPLLDINKNNYPLDHQYHAIAELVVNKPMLDYKDLIENAREIHCIESSFYCFASHCDLSKVSKKVCYAPHDNSAHRLGIFTTGLLS
jgi:hypothetical protein